MFSNFAWSEMLIIAIVAIIVVGPKDLPGMLRSFGKTVGNLKRMAGDFQRQFNDAIREADMDDLKEMTSTKGFAPLEDAKRSMEEFARSMEAPADAEPETEAPSVSPPPASKSAEAKPEAGDTAPAKKAAANQPAAKTASSEPKANGTGKTPGKPAPKRAAPRKAAAKNNDAAKPAEEKTAT